MAAPPSTPTQSLGSGVRGGKGNTAPKTPKTSLGTGVHGSRTSAGNGGSKGPAATTAPNALTPLTPKQIVNQARTTITKAYAPQYQDLNQQTKLAEGLASKRAADNQYYQTWLDTQGQALQAHADAADAQLHDQNSMIAAQQSQLYSQQPGQLVRGADDRAGNVSNNSDSLAFGADLNANQQQNMGLLQNTENLSNQVVDSAKGQVGAALSQNSNVIQNVREKALTDLDTALTTIAATRSKLGTAQTGDIAKEIARLQGIEISKAQSNRDFTVAVEKMGLTAAETKSLIQSRDLAGVQAGQRLALQQKGLDLALTKAQLQQMNADRNYQLDAKKYSASVAKDLYERDHNLGPYKLPSTGVTKPLSVTSQNVIYHKVDAAGAEMNNLINNYGLTPNEAYHVVLNGGPVVTGHKVTGHKVDPKTGKSVPITTPTTMNIPAVGDSQIVNAAYNAVRNGGSGLTPGDVAALKAMGLADPGSRYSVHHTLTGGGAAAGAAGKVLHGLSGIL